MKEYLSETMRHGLIVYDDRAQIYKITDKGRRFLALYKQMTESIITDKTCIIIIHTLFFNFLLILFMLIIYKIICIFLYPIVIIDKYLDVLSNGLTIVHIKNIILENDKKVIIGNVNYKLFTFGDTYPL